jgi:hypothetical protein
MRNKKCYKVLEPVIKFRFQDKKKSIPVTDMLFMVMVDDRCKGRRIQAALNLLSHPLIFLSP